MLSSRIKWMSSDKRCTPVDRIQPPLPRYLRDREQVYIEYGPHSKRHHPHSLFLFFFVIVLIIFLSLSIVFILAFFFLLFFFLLFLLFIVRRCLLLLIETHDMTYKKRGSKKAKIGGCILHFKPPYFLP